MPKRPPKAWFDRCVESVSTDPAVTDPQAVCAWNWYYHMTPARRREILRGEVFDPELDLDSETYIYDPKIKKKRRMSIKEIKKTFQEAIDQLELMEAEAKRKLKVSYDPKIKRKKKAPKGYKEWTPEIGLERFPPVYEAILKDKITGSTWYELFLAKTDKEAKRKAKILAEGQNAKVVKLYRKKR